MNKEPCTEAQLREVAAQEHNGSLQSLLDHLRNRLAKTRWPPGRAHLENDILELELIIKHEQWLKKNG